MEAGGGGGGVARPAKGRGGAGAGRFLRSASITETGRGGSVECEEPSPDWLPAVTVADSSEYNGEGNLPVAGVGGADHGLAAGETNNLLAASVTETIAGDSDVGAHEATFEGDNIISIV